MLEQQSSFYLIQLEILNNLTKKKVKTMINLDP